MGLSWKKGDNPGSWGTILDCRGHRLEDRDLSGDFGTFLDKRGRAAFKIGTQGTPETPGTEKRTPIRFPLSSLLSLESLKSLLVFFLYRPRRRTSNSTSAAATVALSDSTAGSMGMVRRRVARASRVGERPGPSAPTARISVPCRGAR